MPDATPKTPEQDEDAKTNRDQNSQDLEEAQKEAAEEREDEGGYQ
jgi:hypothetical protein